MILSELINTLNNLYEKYGDLPVYHLNNANLRDPEPGHSNDDYGTCFWTGETWHDVGLKPSIILDYDPHSADPLILVDDEYSYFGEI